ncbi:unnamed protein product [Euphydryas editha]|uniref:Alpha-and gamma-adaptin-binding protein p34 n=1 Tax=Euphydryas editha TaxID=104508 RepID=A0AAU9UZT0_EUPED|nr:unnamed protein product [Euphydryas editha]
METPTEVSSNPTKPMILISAKDLTSASVFISDLTDGNIIENNVKVTNRKPWRIINKYYCVDVEIYSLADSEPPPLELADHVEAHIIFITDDEDDETGASLAEGRWARARAAGGERASVLLLAADAARAAPALLAWARRRRYELVPLRQSAADDSDADEDPAAPFPETYGAERVRAALHAHAWRGLERLDRHAPRPAPAAPAAPAAPEPTSSDDDYEGLEDPEDDEAAVERAEAFVEALGALGGARADDGLAPGDRLQRAERLVAAFCRALGTDLPAL